MRTTHHVRDSFAHNADHLAHDTPLSAFVAEVVCTSGATPPRTATSPPRTTTSPPRTATSPPRTATSPPPNGGNCTNRATTRRRHAEARLLMVQNPHHYPGRHAPSLASRSLTGGAGQPGGAPINACRASPTGPCCTGAGRAGADKRQKGVAERTGAGTRVARSATTLAADQVKHPIGDHSTRSDRAQCSRSG